MPLCVFLLLLLYLLYLKIYYLYKIIPTPALRPKRATRALARFNKTVSKAGGKKDKGKGRQV
jgi:hypothetical protein